MRTSHAMPFGAAARGDAPVRFRLWAPAETAVSLVLEDRNQRVPMSQAGAGWFEVTTDLAAPGDRYRYELADGLRVPDPASRRQSGDVHGSSVVVDPFAYRWTNPDWRGRPWREAVLYELHVGTFSPRGNFDGVREKLAELAATGITAIELMPVADFRGRWNWGYDGVLLFAPDESYGTPDQLKALIDAAHGLGLMVFLDVVYNHFGPDGNYLHRYAPDMFTNRRQTPWGAAIDYAQPVVRDFFIHNAVYWIEEYRFDGLRFDAVHEIVDERRPGILEDIARAVRTAAGPEREVHLVLENDDNCADLLIRNADGVPTHYTAQWNDDFHHVAHVVLTHESSGYYSEYVDQPVGLLAKALAEGFISQGQHSAYRDRPRGQPSRHLPPTAFVDFIQNHDQIGNRAFGERLTTLASPEALRAMSAIQILAPSIPLLFMGEEWGAVEPFCFFTDFEGELADAVRKGRRNEFSRFADFADPAARERIPDPQAESTYRRSMLDWTKRNDSAHRDTLDHYRSLLELRRTEIAPRLGHVPQEGGTATATENGLLIAHWTLGDGAKLHLVAQLSAAAGQEPAFDIAGRLIWATSPTAARRKPLRDLPPWFVGFFLEGM